MADWSGNDRRAERDRREDWQRPANEQLTSLRHDVRNLFERDNGLNVRIEDTVLRVRELEQWKDRMVATGFETLAFDLFGRPDREASGDRGAIGELRQQMGSIRTQLYAILVALLVAIITGFVNLVIHR